MRVAWVTGGGSGIGRAVAAGLLAEGARVAISGRRPTVLEETAAALRQKTSAEVLAVACDVTSAESLAAAHRTIVQTWGNVQTLVNNAGANRHGAFDTAPDAEFEDAWAGNCRGAIASTRLVLPAMRAARGGAIINIASIYGLVASSDSPAYTISKFAVTGLNEVLHQLLAGTGVHMMGVYPGYIRTAMTEPFVKPGSFKWQQGRSAEQMASAILRGLRRRQRDVYFPWYVPWIWRANRWFPKWIDRSAKNFRARGETHS